MGEFIECLVFLESENRSTCTTENNISESRSAEKRFASKKYILFPSDFKYHPYGEIFRQRGFQVEIDPPANLQFEFFEVLLAEDSESKKLCLYVDDHYHLPLGQLLGESWCIRPNKKSNHECDDSDILSAVDEENIALIDKFLTHGADIRYGCKGTILHFAAKNGYTALLKLLLERGANPNAKMDDCSTALHIAVEKCNTEIAQLLLENKADSNAVMSKGITPLHVAVERSSPEICKLLVENASDLSVRNGDGWTPLHIAAQRACVKIVEHLLLHGAKTDLERRAITNARSNDCSTALHIAVKGKKIKIAQFLLENRADVNAIMADCVTPIHIAVEKGFTEMTRLLVEKGADLSVCNGGGSTLLHIAVKGGHVKIVELLLLYIGKTGLDRSTIINATLNDCSTALHIAVKGKNMEIAQLLLGNKADVNAVMVDHVTPLHLAVESGFIEMVRLLVQNGADLNVRKSNGATPLHIAVKNGYVNIVEHLLLHGANPNTRGTEDPQHVGETPLHRAILDGSYGLIALLLEKGADVNAELHDGRTALYLAVKEAQLILMTRLDICSILIKYGPDVNLAGNRKAFYHALSQHEKRYKLIITQCFLKHKFDVIVDDADNSCLLFGAIFHNLHSTVKKLLDFGADVNQFRKLEHNMKVSPLHEAAMFADKAMIQLLLHHGANINASEGNGPVITPLLRAIQYRNVKTVEALLANNPNVTGPPSVLHLAVMINTGDRVLEVVQVLLEHGVDVNSCIASGQTPLSLAAFTNNSKVIYILIKFGARGCFRDREPKTILCSDNFQVLLDHGFTDFDSTSEIHCQKFLNRPREHINFSKCAEKLACHIVKMEAAYESIGPTIPTQLREKLKLIDFKNNCEKEIATLKLEIIPNTKVSLYNILTKKTYQLSCYARNENTLESLENFNIKEKFPIYGSIIECQVRKGILRRQLINGGMKTLNFLSSGFFKLPHDLKERIVNYLNNQDVLILQKCRNNKADC